MRLLLLLLLVQEPVYPGNKLAWDQPAPTLTEASIYQYFAYIDGTQKLLLAASCAQGNGIPIGSDPPLYPFTCTAPFPSLSWGEHTVQVGAEYNGVASALSTTLTVRFSSETAPPSPVSVVVLNTESAPPPLTPEDDFNGPDGPVSASWGAMNAAQCPSHKIISNEVASGVEGNFCFSRWVSSTFSSDHYSELTVRSQLAYTIVVVRAQATSLSNGYAWIASFRSDSTGAIYKFEDGSGSLLKEGIPPPPTGAKMRLVADGSTIIAYTNDVEVGRVTDTRFSGGGPGIGVSYGARADNWRGGNVR